MKSFESFSTETEEKIEVRENQAESREELVERVAARYLKPFRRIAVLASAVALGYFGPLEKAYAEEPGRGAGGAAAMEEQSSSASFEAVVEKLPGGSVKIGESKTDSGKEIEIYQDPQGDSEEYFGTNGEEIKKFTATSKRSALEFAPDFFEMSSSIRKTFDAFVKREKEMIAHGFVELPGKKHGIVVPGSEREGGGKRVHTEVRRTWDGQENGIDVITEWVIDSEGNEIDYKVHQKDSDFYTQHKALADQLAEQFQK